MNETSQGSGWWEASDGSWYPPTPQTLTPPTPAGHSLLAIGAMVVGSLQVLAAFVAMI